MTKPALAERLSYYGLEPHDPAYKSVNRVLRSSLDATLDKFYGEVGTRKNLAGKFESPASLNRARAAQARHWTSAFSEGLGENFLNRSRHIGAVHARIGLEPKWYVGSYARIMEELLTAIIAPGWKRYLPWKQAEARRVVALVKVSLLDMDIALSSYFVDMNEKVNSLNTVLGGALAQLADGKLNIDPVDLPGEYAGVARDFNSTVAALHKAVSSVVEGVEAIATGSSEIRSASDDLARRTESQAASLEETAASVTLAAQRVREARETASKARGTIRDTNQKAGEGAQIVAEAVSAMNKIVKSSDEISSIIGVIDSIAFQTNLLALNAGVEAARAGESGRGFAVVASEVRALAQRCSDAAEEVKTLITGTSAHVAAGVNSVENSGTAFDAIAQGIGDLTDAIETIADSTEVQAESLSQIDVVIGELDRSTQQNAAMAEQCTAAATSLAQEAESLGTTAGVFEVDSARSLLGNSHAGMRAGSSGGTHGKLALTG
ncbi:MAG: globin-coupled sensor protein [Erythrobacter sp.]